MHRPKTFFSLVIATVLLCAISLRLVAGTSLDRSSALAQAQTTQDLKAEAERLNQEGKLQYRQGKFPDALESFQKLLAIFRELHDKVGERATLNNIATVYGSQGQYFKELETLQQLLAIVREIPDKAGEATTLNNIAAVYGSQGQYPKALESYQQALTLLRELQDKAGERAILNNIAMVYRNLGQYPKALEIYEQLLSIVRELDDKTGEGATVNNIAVVYRNLGQYPKALELFEQALAIKRALNDKAGEASTLNNIAVIYREQSQYPKALELFEQALSVYKLLGNKAGEVTTLSNIAAIYDTLGQYPKALNFFEQALAIYQEVNQQRLATNRELSDQAGEGKTLNNIGEVYQSLNQYSKALEFYQKALVIEREIDDKAGQTTTLNNMAVVSGKQGQYAKALELFNQALAIVRAINDKAGERTNLNNMAAVYRNLKQYPQALEFYQKALAIEREIDNRTGQEITLTGMGVVYFNQGQYTQALESYQQALGIQREVGDKAGEGTTLSNIGYLLKQQKQPELAIVFYKQSVNVNEEIRNTIRVLPREQQESYTQTVADTYRSLADLLLSQGRVLEAQQVLELIKIQELRDFTKETRTGGQTSGSPLNPSEEQILKKYGTLIAFGQKVYECKLSSCSQLSQLNNQLQVLTQQYNQTVQTFEKEIQSRRAQDDAFFDPSKLAKAKEIVEAQAGTVLIYPLVLEDKIWLLWASKGGVIKSVEVSQVGKRQLGETVLKFRQLLQNPSSNLTEVKATGKKLYDWLIKPIETELKDNKIQNLVFSLDRAARYIPMSALFDGEKYLIENYAVSMVLSADLTDTRDRLPPGTQNTSILAMGLSDAIAGFNPLPNVPAELDAIVRKQPNDTQGIYPGREFLNQAFDFPALRDNLLGYKLLHIATHGQFVPGRQEESYLLLGKGEKLTISQIKTLQDLSNVHLVVLSACETALGGPDQDGVEISGISYYFLNAGAKAVMASLWLVNDDSTRQLMQNFYSNLAKGTAQAPLTKVQALQQAQLSLLHGKTNVLLAQRTDQRSSLEAKPRVESQTASTNSTSPSFSHPYYWAPFILIGNGS